MSLAHRLEPMGGVGGSDPVGAGENALGGFDDVEQQHIGKDLFTGKGG